MPIDRGKKEPEVDLAEVLDDLERRIERLKILYEQYFMGIERIEPQTARKDCMRRLRDFTELNVRNTALRYRFNALKQKWGVYQTYWNRTLRAIENGTYYRDVARVGREAARRGVDVPDELLRAMPARMRDRILRDRAALAQRAESVPRREAHGRAALPIPEGSVGRGEVSGAAAPAEDLSAHAHPGEGPAVGAGEERLRAPPRMFDGDDSLDADVDALFDSLAVGAAPRPAAARPQGAPRASAGPPPPPAGPIPAPPRAPVARDAEGSSPRRAPALPPGMDERAARDLFQSYVHARRLVGDDSPALSYDQVVEHLARQAPRLLAQHRASALEFSVVVKDRKVVLRAKPKG